MTANQRRAAAFVFTLALSTFTWWLFGFDFDARGFHAGWGFLIVIGVSALAATCPIWDDDK